jgi:hypothetical protein
MGHLLKLKCSHSPKNVGILSSTSVPVRPTTAQMPNLVLVETKRITVFMVVLERALSVTLCVHQLMLGEGGRGCWCGV